MNGQWPPDRAPGSELTIAELMLAERGKEKKEHPQGSRLLRVRQFRLALTREIVAKRNDLPSIGALSMSEPFGFALGYRAVFEPDTIRTVLTALKEAVAENWERQRDRMSDAEPNVPVEIDAWLEKATPQSMKQSVADEKQFFTEELFFSYSPISVWLGRIMLIKRQDETLAVMFIIAGSGRYEAPSDREKYRPHLRNQPHPPDAPQPWEDGYQEWEEDWYAPYNVDMWSINRQCILHLLDRLKEALPVEYVSVDESLRGRGASGC